MLFESIMHVSFYTDHMDEMLDFYLNKLGLKQKTIVRWKEYKGSTTRPYMAQMAETDPEGIFYTYLEIAPEQFIELFPMMPNQQPHREWNKDLGYTHFALTCSDIYATVEELKHRGVEPDTEISKGPSETYQVWFHDPDGNRFELMQYTEKSWQLVGHFS